MGYPLQSTLQLQDTNHCKQKQVIIDTEKMEETSSLRRLFRSPFICSAPMRTISGPELATAVTLAGGLGFIGAGYSLSNLCETLSQTSQLLRNAGCGPIDGLLPIGVGFLPWNCSLSNAIPPLKQYPPLAVWLFGTANTAQLTEWIQEIKKELPKTAVFVQVGSVEEAKAVLLLPGYPVDVLIAQGVADAGGHGLQRGASVISILPETLDLIAELKIEGQFPKDRGLDVLATGGIMDGRGVAAALALGAHGAVLGTRLIATPESEAPPGFKAKLISTHDGGQNTVRTRFYDNLRGVGNWPSPYNARAIVNDSYHDFEKGLDEDTIKQRYQIAAASNDFKRLTAFAGTGVGLIKDIQPAGKIVEDARAEAKKILERLGRQYGA